jgi:hypothetical protein
VGFQESSLKGKEVFHVLLLSREATFEVLSGNAGCNSYTEQERDRKMLQTGKLCK